MMHLHQVIVGANTGFSCCLRSLGIRPVPIGVIEKKTEKLTDMTSFISMLNHKNL